jgi:hypothetical protein
VTEPVYAPTAGDVRSLRPDDLAQVLAIAEEAAFAPLRYLAVFGHGDVVGPEQRDRTGRQLTGPGTHLILEDDGVIRGEITVHAVDDLTEHFGRTFYDVGPVLAPAATPIERGTIASRLLSAAIEVAVDGVSVLRVESDDRATLRAAEDLGFRIMETSLTYVNDLGRADRNLDPESPDIALHHLGIDAPIPNEAFDEVRVGADQLTEDHYHADPRLPDALCNALYRRLLERGLRGEGADALVLRMHEDRIIGLGIWRHWKHLDPYGVSMAGNGFGFRAFYAAPGSDRFTAFVCNNSLTGNRLLEWTTQSTNFPMVNMICSQRSIRLCRSSYVLHRWSDGRWD